MTEGARGSAGLAASRAAVPDAMSIVRYLSHPQVRIDPATPVPEWRLSPLGRARTEAVARAGWLAPIGRVVASRERKAIETAGIIAPALGLTVEVRDGLHENDRSATGFLAPAEFEVVADQFFARPEESVRGWERAADAQARIVAAVTAMLMEGAGERDTLLVGHGGVGTLLLCALAALPIDRRHDQEAGGGCYFSFEQRTRRLLHPWRPMEQAPPSA